MERLKTGAGRLQDALKKICTVHHVLNILLSSIFFISKTVTPICQFLFTDAEQQCGLDRREHEIFAFLCVVIFWKNRKATNWLHYLSNVFLFARLASAGLFFRLDPLIGIIYGVCCLGLSPQLASTTYTSVVTVIYPEPAYSGPERITYFQGTSLQEELDSNKRCVWLIEFYTTWSPECRHMSPVFAQLSEKYTLPNLRFGKCDVGKYGKEAERFRVNTHPTSRQLPTVVLFRDGKEQQRRPLVGGRGRAIHFVFSEENCILDFDLNNVYRQCKETMSKVEKKELEEEETKKTR